MFINISNHPSSGWSKEQINKATEIGGKVIDIQFPKVDPREYGKLSKDVNTVIDALPRLGNNDVFHIMGEMGLTYQLVSLLNDTHDVYHSTSERVSEEVDGVKVSKFKFVQFRKYI